MRKVIFVIGFGLLPVIAAGIFVYVGSLSYHVVEIMGSDTIDEKSNGPA